jgi:hypothetical protein
VGQSKASGLAWRTARLAGGAAWLLLGAWAALAAYFTAPLGVWPAAAVGTAVFALFLSATRERWRARGPGVAWRSALALAAAGASAVWFFVFTVPDPDEPFITKHARTAKVRFDGDLVHVQNVRDMDWRTPTDYTPRYHDRVYDLRLLNSMYFCKSPIMGLEPVAHVWVSFGFADGQTVSISVEARGVKERPFGLFRSMFRQFQLIYAVGEERDVAGLRGAVWQNRVRFYPAKSTDERKRWLFVDMLRRADALDKKPEWYNLFFNNCMNNVTYHIRRLGDRPLPRDVWLVLTGFSDQAAFDYGFIDTTLPLEKAQEAFRIDPWMRDTPRDETFSLRLRQQLAKQVAAAGG